MRESEALETLRPIAEAILTLADKMPTVEDLERRASAALGVVEKAQGAFNEVEERTKASREEFEALKSRKREVEAETQQLAERASANISERMRQAEVDGNAIIERIKGERQAEIEDLNVQRRDAQARLAGLEERIREAQATYAQVQAGIDALSNRLRPTG